MIQMAGFPGKEQLMEKVWTRMTCLLLMAMLLCACQTADQPTQTPSSVKIVFIPKLTGVGFFESGGQGALSMGEQLGITVVYDGPNAPSVNGQIDYINKYIDAGYNAIAISSLSPDGLCETLQKAMAKGILNETESPTMTDLPPLAFDQTRRVDHRLILRRH